MKCLLLRRDDLFVVRSQRFLLHLLSVAFCLFLSLFVVIFRIFACHCVLTLSRLPFLLVLYETSLAFIIFFSILSFPFLTSALWCYLLSLARLLFHYMPVSCCCCCCRRCCCYRVCKVVCVQNSTLLEGRPFVRTLLFFVYKYLCASMSMLLAALRASSFALCSYPLWISF